jgi:phage-related protein
LDYINGFDERQRAKIYNHLRLLRTLGVRIGEPQAKKIKGHEPLWELRPMPARLIYFAFIGRRFIILHAFTKKKDKLDPKEIKIAENRYLEFLEREK